jgi:hypothetical protein
MNRVGTVDLGPETGTAFRKTDMIPEKGKKMTMLRRWLEAYPEPWLFFI